MITRWPGERLQTFDRFNKMMSDMLGGNEMRGIWAPPVDVKETEKEIVFEVDLPGINEKDVEVELAGDVLIINGSREFKEEEKKDDYVRVERSYGSFRRSFTLGAPVKVEEVKASFKDGVLTVTVPKIESKPTQKIEVKRT